MNTITLTPQPQSGQTNALGSGVSVTFMSNSAPLVGPGDLFQLQISAPADANRGEIGYQVPGDGKSAPTYAGSLDANGNLTVLGQYSGSSPISLASGEGLLVSVGVLPGNTINPLGFMVCSFLPAPAPAPAPTPSLATLVAAVQASWQTGVPVVDPFNPATWMPTATSGFTTVNPVTGQPEFVPYPTGPYNGISLAQPAANAIVALLGGYVQAQNPLPADFNPFVNGVEGTLTEVLYIFAPMPIGPGGAVVMAEANAGKVANALLYRAAVGGIQQAILNAFTAV